MRCLGVKVLLLEWVVGGRHREFDESFFSLFFGYLIFSIGHREFQFAPPLAGPDCAPSHEGRWAFLILIAIGFGVLGREW